MKSHGMGQKEHVWYSLAKFLDALTDLVQKANGLLEEEARKKLEREK